MTGPLDAILGLLKISYRTDGVSDVVSQLAAAVRSLSDADAASLLNKNPDKIIYASNALTAGLTYLDGTIDDITDKYGNLDLSKLGRLRDPLDVVSEAENYMRTVVLGMESGSPSGLYVQSSDVASNLEGTSNTEKDLTGSVDDVKGFSSLFVYLFTTLTGARSNLNKLSVSLYELYDALKSKTSDPEYSSVISAIAESAKIQNDLAASLGRINF